MNYTIEWDAEMPPEVAKWLTAHPPKLVGEHPAGPFSLETARRIGWVLGHADDGCPSCVAELCRRASEMFPQFLFEPRKTGEFLRLDVDVERADN